MTVIDPSDTYIPFSKQITGFIEMMLVILIGVILFKIATIVRIYESYDPYINIPLSSFLKIVGLIIWLTYFMLIFKDHIKIE